MAEAIDMVDGHAASVLYHRTKIEDPALRKKAVDEFWKTCQEMADKVNNA
jgi:hypothetical protein